MSLNKKRLPIRNIFTSRMGCSTCGNPKSTDIFQPKPKPKTTIKPKPINLSLSSSSSCERTRPSDHSIDDDDEDYTSTTFSLNIDSSPQSSEPENDPNCSKMVSPCPKISDSLAVMKDSDDPYLDFRNSMLQMILEREIYSKEDLQELLICFLELNSSSHHEIIVQAFTEIWNSVVLEKLSGVTVSTCDREDMV